MIRLVTLFLCLLLLPSLALAGKEPPPRRVLKLDLETALQDALRRNFSIEVQRIDSKIAGEGVRRELGQFDPVFNITATRDETTNRDVFNNGVQLQSRNISRLDRLSSGISGVTAWGAKYDLGYGSRGNTGNTGLLGDLYDTTGSLSLTQPLLRGAGTAVTLAQVRIARNAAKVSEWQLRKQVIDVLTQTSDAYNELQLSIENLRVAERSRGLARQLLKDNQARVEIGVKSPLEVTEARAAAAAREEDVIRGQRAVMNNENFLKQLVTGDLLEMLETRLEIDPPPSPRFTGDVRGGIADALAMRPDYRQALLDLDRRHIQVVVQKNQLLPRIDLTGSLALLGLDNDSEGSFSRIGRRDQTAWSAGVIFSIPLGNREASASLRQARLEVAKSLLAIEALEQQIIVDVDNAVGQIVTSQESITTSRVARRLARESLDAGEERLRAGTGTTFEVLELQKKLSDAEALEHKSTSTYNKSVARYHQDTGTTLREHNVVLE